MHLESVLGDFAHAYKHVPLEVSQREFATIVFADPNGEVFYSTLRTQPFGSRPAPANWGRVAAFTKWVMIRLFACVVKIFADDCFVAEPDATVGPAFSVLLGVCDLLGLVLEHSKTKAPTDRMLLLGADIRISISDVTVTIPDRKRADIATELQMILRKNTLTPADAAKMRGRLGYAQFLVKNSSGGLFLSCIVAPFWACRKDYDRSVR